MYFLDSYRYGENSETCEVVIQHRGKRYTGCSRRHPDDQDRPLLAGRLAEMRAEIAALKEERNAKKAECEAVRKYLTACQQTKEFDKNSDMAKIMFHQFNLRVKEVNALTDAINQRLLAIRAAIKAIDKVEKFIDKKD